MNDLPWVKYDPKRMFLDLMGMSVLAKVAHVALFNYTLYNDGPPRNDNDSLRDITGCPPADWGRTKRELLGKGWLETPNFFLHRGTIKTLNEAKETFVGNQNRSLAAQKASYRLELLPADPETGVISYRMTNNVTPPVTPIVTETQEQEQLQEPKEIESPPPYKPSSKHSHRIPELKEVLLHAGRIGMTEADATQWFNDRQAEGWCDANGVDIGNWKVWMTRYRDRQRTAPKGISPATEAILREKELREVEERIKSLTGGDAHTDLTDTDRAELRRLRARQREIKTLLGWKL